MAKSSSTKAAETPPEAETTVEVPASVPAPRVSRSEQLDAWFVYHPPTPETVDAYNEIGAAYERCVLTFEAALSGKLGVNEKFSQPTNACREFVEVIDRVCPSCADATAAVRYVRLARNGVNDTLCGKSTPVAFAFDELRRAKFTANSAIACRGL